MRKLAIVLMPLLILALVVGAVGCVGGGEALSPEAKEISDFLNDKHVNAVLWEEWNIFYEWNLVKSMSSLAASEYWPRKKALENRAAQNLQDIRSINPPESLGDFWSKLTLAVDNFVCNGCPGEVISWGRENLVPRQHAEAWLELRRISREHDIKMEWPLPAIPS